MTTRGYALCLMMSLIFAQGCHRDAPCGPDSIAQPVDPALLAFLSRARAAHHIADEQEEHHPDRALATLRTVLDGPLPGHPDARPAEVREVLADTSARIADLESQGQHFEAAVQTIQRALGWVPDNSYFRGHLYEVLGLVEERRAQVLAKSGSPAQAEEAKGRALSAFEQSMNIQAEVIKTLSIDAGKP